MKKYIARGVIALFVIFIAGYSSWATLNAIGVILNTPMDEIIHTLSVFAAFALILTPIFAIAGGVILALRWALDNA